MKAKTQMTVRSARLRSFLRLAGPCSNTMMRSSVYAEGMFKVMIKTGKSHKGRRVLDPTQNGKITTPVNSESFVYTVPHLVQPLKR